MNKVALILSMFGVAGVMHEARSETLQTGNLSVPAADVSFVSEYEAGKKFLNGQDVEKNPAKALEHFQKAAELGHIEAPGAIGYFYAAGLGVE